MDLHRLPIRALAHLLETKLISSRELVGYFLNRIDRLDTSINSIVARNDQVSLDSATRIDKLRSQGRQLGALAGIPFGVKDLEDVEGFVTTFGSTLHANASISSSNSLLVQRLVDAGAIPIGKTNTSEYGWKATTDNKLFGHTRNPFDLDKTSGGSSGGTAAAVCAGLLPFGTSSDGGGSIRIPAAACGIAGLKTSAGRVPIRGSKPPDWWNLSTSGPMARTISDTAWLYDICVGPHLDDPGSLPKKNDDWASEVQNLTDYPRVGFSRNLGYWKTDNEILCHLDSVVEMLSDLGFEVVEVPNIFDEQPYLTWIRFARAYQARTLGHLVGTEQFNFLDPGLAQNILEGLEMSAVDLVVAMDQAWKMSYIFFEKLVDLDILITPTLAGLPPNINCGATINDQPTTDWVSYTSFANVIKTPAVSICVGATKNGFPISLQIHGKRFGEIGILRLANLLEKQFQAPIPPHY